MQELEIIQHPQIEGLSLFFDTIDYRTAHMHPEWELLWVLEHPLHVTCGQKQLLLQPGQMILFGPNVPHELHKQDRPSTFLCLQLGASLLPWLPPMVVEEPTLHSFFSEEELRLLGRQLGDLERAYLRQAPHYELWCTGQAMLLFHQLFSRMNCRPLTPEEISSAARRNERLQRLIRFVDENYQHKLRLSDFAQAEGCSLSYLSRFIKSTMNLSFQDYVASVRFQAACRMIAAGQTKMLEVCMEAGFSDYRYFCRMFRRQYGMTPEQYSRSCCPLSAGTPAPRSLRSVERFYTAEESLELLNKFHL